jgi:hypothetical protein
VNTISLPNCRFLAIASYKHIFQEGSRPDDGKNMGFGSVHIAMKAAVAIEMMSVKVSFPIRRKKVGAVFITAEFDDTGSKYPPSPLTTVT